MVPILHTGMVGPEYNLLPVQVNTEGRLVVFDSASQVEEMCDNHPIQSMI